MSQKISKSKNCAAGDLGKEHYQRLRHHNSQTFWMTIILAGAMVVSLWYDDLPPAQISLWTGLLLLAAGIRLSLNLANSRAPEFDHHLWNRKYIVLTTVMSLIWGSTGIWLFPTDPVMQMVMIVLLLSALVSAAPVILVSNRAFHAQFVAVLTPVAILMVMNYADIAYVLLIAALSSLALMILLASNYIHQVILELHDTQEALKAQADTDQLTQIANRRFFERSFKREWRRSSREKQSISLMMVDIDDFKQYNDSFGHQAGDDCLRKIAKTINISAKRPGDTPARIGGEEFAVLLPNTDAQGAATVAKRLQKGIQRLLIPSHITGKYISVSIGISSCHPGHRDDSANTSDSEGQDIVYPAMLMKSADFAMYAAKRKGKNQIVSEACGMHSVHASLKDKDDHPPLQAVADDASRPAALP